METYDITQVLMTIGTIHEVRVKGSSAVVMSIKGSLMSPTPKFTMRAGEGSDGPELASLSGNFVKTKFQIVDAEAKPLGGLVFPAVAFKKTLTLTVGSHEYSADGGFFGGVFRCADASGEVVLEIAKEVSIRDKFMVTAKDPITKEVALLAAVAIHSRFFEMV